MKPRVILLCLIMLTVIGTVVYLLFTLSKSPFDVCLPAEEAEKIKKVVTEENRNKISNLVYTKAQELQKSVLCECKDNSKHTDDKLDVYECQCDQGYKPVEGENRCQLTKASDNMLLLS